MVLGKKQEGTRLLGFRILWGGCIQQDEWALLEFFKGREWQILFCV